MKATRERTATGLSQGRDRAAALLIVLGASTSVGAFLLDVAGWSRMPFTINAISLPAVVMVVGIAVWADRTGRRALLRRLWVGVVAGVIATGAYDLVRALIALAVPGGFDPFRAHRPFGALILGTSSAATSALVAGWVYHAWNGVSFGVMYTVVAGAARFWWALLWALALEAATLTVYPVAFDIGRSDVAFVGVSFLGHAAYGFTLGVLARGWLGAGSSPDAWRLGRPNVTMGIR